MRFRRCRLAVLLVPCVLSFAPAAADAALFLKVGDIEGEVNVDGYQDWIEVEQFGIAVGRAVSSPAGGGGDRETSTPQFSDFAITGTTSRASVHLFTEAVMGRGIPQVTLDLTRFNKDREEVYAQWVLSDAIMTSYSTAGSGENGVRPTESYGFAFGKITYRWIDKAGTAAFTWDLEQNRQSFTTTGTVSDFQFLTGTLVPEPASAALFGLAGAGLLLRRRARRGA